jgi:hypothetical protein
MRPHRTDGISLSFGLLFLLVAVWWAIAQVVNVKLPAAGWLVAGALILFGVIGLLGAIRSGRRTEVPATVQAEAQVETPGDLPPELHADIVRELLDNPADRVDLNPAYLKHPVTDPAGPAVQASAPPAAPASAPPAAPASAPPTFGAGDPAGDEPTASVPLVTGDGDPIADAPTAPIRRAAGNGGPAADEPTASVPPAAASGDPAGRESATEITRVDLEQDGQPNGEQGDPSRRG